MRAQVLTVVLLLLSNGVLASPGDKVLVREGVIQEDAYLAAERVVVNGEAKGDLFIGASDIRVSGTVDGDLFAAGDKISVDAKLNDDIRMFGRLLTVCSSIDGDLILAGADINLCDKTSVAGNTFMAGQNLTIEGIFDGDLSAKGARIILAGSVTGNVDFEAEHIELLPGASVVGNMSYKSPNPAKLHEGSVIGGEEIYSVNESSWWSDPDRDTKSFLSFILGILAIGIIGTTITAFFLAYYLPVLVQQTTATIKQQPLPMIGLGLIVVLLTPFIIVLLLLTIVGAPLAFLLFLSFLLTLVSGFYASLLFISDVVARLLRKSEPLSMLWRLLTVLIAALFIVLAASVPILGIILIILLYLLGTGAVFDFLRTKRRTVSIT